MPANLTPSYLAAEARFRAARTTEEKLAALDEMYATIPKHKGTEKMRADIKRRASKLREKQPGRADKRGDDFDVAREGAGRIVLVGPPGSGKSSLFERLTVAEHRSPPSGLMAYQDVLIQLVDTPPMSDDGFEDGVMSFARTADAVAVVLDLADDLLLDQLEEICAAFARHGMVLIGRYSPEQDYPARVVVRPVLVVGSKSDLPNADDNLDSLRELCGDQFGIQPVSVNTGEGLEELRGELFGLLGGSGD